VGRLARLSLAHGNSDASSLAYVRLASIIGRRFGDYAKGFRYGKLGFDLAEQHGLSRFQAAVDLNFAALVMPWTKHLSTGLGLIRRSATAAEQTGNISYACYARTCLITLLLAQGAPLAEVQRDVDEAYAYTKAHFDLVADGVWTERQLVRMLRGLLPRFGSLTDAELDEETFEARLREPRMAITACWYWIRKLQARFHGDDFAAAVAAAENAAPLLWTSTDFFETAEYHFYAALAQAGRHDQVAPEHRPRHRDALVAHARWLGASARQCPDNFRGRAALADAEIARIAGRDADAARLYEAALIAARESGFVHGEAVAYERAARFWRARGYTLFSDVYLQQACACYRRWGAGGKVEQLQQLTRLTPRVGRQLGVSTLSTSSPAALGELPATSDQLDLLAVIKASQTISGVMGREELVRTLLQIVIEQGGARRACLVRVRDGELEIAAEQTLASEKDAEEAAAPAPGRVPASILHYVARTRQRVVLDDAAADAGRFASDPYLADAHPRSLLCLPIRREGRVVALLVLENELAPGLFTADRLVALELIAAQVAISLENALLLEREREGRVEAEGASRRALILGEATALVSSTFDDKDVFDALTRLCVRELCDWAVIDIVDHDRIVRIAAAHRDPVNAPLMGELTQRYSPRFGVPSLAAGVIERGTPTFLPDLGAEDVRRLCVDDRHFEFIQALGARSAIAVPLVAREAVFGALSLVSATPNRFNAADVELVVEIGRRTALAIDNARLLVATQRAVQLRDQFLSTASHELRTPITSLKLTIEALVHGTRARPLPAAHSRRLQRVRWRDHRGEPGGRGLHLHGAAPPNRGKSSS
jgi:GAF domain-containing protein